MTTVAVDGRLVGKSSGMTQSPTSQNLRYLTVFGSVPIDWSKSSILWLARFELNLEQSDNLFGERVVAFSMWKIRMYAIDDENLICHLKSQEEGTRCGLVPLPSRIVQETGQRLVLAEEKPSTYANCPYCFPDFENRIIRI